MPGRTRNYETNPIIVALDVDHAAEALELVSKLGSEANFYKVGMELYAAGGMEIVRELASRGKNVFLDLKLYDIGETVKRAVRKIAESEGPTYLTVHGSRAVMEAAAQGKGNSNLKLLAVTVLTSFDQEDLADLGYETSISELVALRVRKAVESGMDGIVCSALEVGRVREIGGEELILVTPGVRSAGSSKGDQKRVATPAEAVRDGANHIVIGRQVTRAADPKKAFDDVMAEITIPHLA